MQGERYFPRVEVTQLYERSIASECGHKLKAPFPYNSQDNFSSTDKLNGESFHHPNILSGQTLTFLKNCSDARNLIQCVNTNYLSFCGKRVSSRSLDLAKAVIEEQLGFSFDIQAAWFTLFQKMSYLKGIKLRTLYVVFLSQAPARVPVMNADFEQIDPIQVTKFSKAIKAIYLAHVRIKKPLEALKSEFLLLTAFQISPELLNSWLESMREIMEADSEAHLPTLCMLLLSQIYCHDFIPFEKIILPDFYRPKAAFSPAKVEDKKITTIRKASTLYSLTPMSSADALPSLELQLTVCFSERYGRFPRCLSCTAKQTDIVALNSCVCFQFLKPGKILEEKGFVTAGEAELYKAQIPTPRPSASRKRRSAKTIEFIGPSLEIAPSNYVPLLESKLVWNSEYVLAQIKDPLLKLLKVENEFINAYKDELRYRKPIGPINQVCDVCKAGIFSVFWLCNSCGKELCLNCYSNWDEESFIRRGLLERCRSYTAHGKEKFIPLTNYMPERICQLYEAVESLDDLLTSPSEKSLEYPYMDAKDLSEDVFRSYWQLGQPIVLKNSLSTPLYPVTPKHFIEHYGNNQVDILTLDGKELETTTIEKFFERLTKFHNANLGKKIKDFPSFMKFSEALPHINRDFMNQLPVPEYMSYKGSLNLVSLLPANNHIVPDLGPKMYVAYAGNNVAISGTTQLHLDAADAINGLQYSAGPTGEAGAIWHLFRREDADKIREFIKSKFNRLDISDPIHDQLFYLTDSLLEELFIAKGVRPFIVEQRVGEFVLVPAGCPHQVRNFYPCIKIAMDYVSPEGAATCVKLGTEFRVLPRWHNRNVDILNIPTLLAQSWATCFERLGKVSPFQEGDILMPPKKRTLQESETVTGCQLKNP
ncbi:hypothetical protein L0F63_007112 [Massospora cicadina]|nr:hypothetical protein L0F63_007112 [Massospora cicadina]